MSNKIIKGHRWQYCHLWVDMRCDSLQCLHRGIEALVGILSLGVEVDLVTVGLCQEFLSILGNVTQVYVPAYIQDFSFKGGRGLFGTPSGGSGEVFETLDAMSL